VEPTSVREVLDELARDEDARCLAGGATLVAMMNADLLAPSALIGLRQLTDLKGITIDNGRVRIGAMTTHSEIAKEMSLSGAAAVVRDAAGQIAHPAIRNMGTIGGSICHADPAADFAPALVAANASVEAVGTGGTREIPISEFFLDYFETALNRDEILTAVIVPLAPEAAVGRHLKFARVEGDYATVSISVVVQLSGKECTYARVAAGSVGPIPVHLEEADAVLTGSKLSQADVNKAGELLAQASDPVDDVRGSAAYRRLLIPRLLGRAIEQALGQGG